MTQTAAPGWYQDPFGHPAVRWWDGAAWTEHTRQPPTAPPPPHAPAPMPAPAPAPIPAQAHGPSTHGPEALLGAQALVVDQNFKWVDISTSYNILDRHGATVGSVAETGQNGARKALRLMSNMDKYLSRQFEIRDAAGVPFLVLSRGTKVVRAKVAVNRPDGTPVGEIVQQQVVGHISFDLLAGGQPVGHLRADGWYAFTFTVTDHNGTEVGRIARDGLGLTLSVLGGTDHYYVEFLHPLPEPLRSLAVAAALTANTLLNPDSHGDQ
ncbi:phospholipid scramblase-related protein [Kitasatospora sp. McL0602]|uniref:phospholipid scramblase-related protein n=1 Tax=Kitasatospora sp. McL0602 TaxID=3439530 RepID=UPI003F8C8415